MKKKLFSLGLLLVLGLTAARADEGMWFLKLMERQHLADSLRRAGCQLPPEAIYSETSPSLRDCIGVFGNGCTGEVVSPGGLVLTNHHCGFSYVHAMSTIEHNYLKDGYFATRQSEELPVPYLTFTFVRRIDDVTAAVHAEAARVGADEYTAQSQAFLQPLAAKMLRESDLKRERGVEAEIVPFFGGNEFYLIIKQVYSDVRLVATPPNNVGQFGGNSDNWIWPRQNADFAMFRIYADAKGRPADYDRKNVPLKVTKFLPVSMKGVSEGDFTMIMGFPGSTSRYLTASEVKLHCESSNAPFVLAGEPMLAYYKKLMDSSDSLRLKYEDTYFLYGNAVKNYGGMNEAVERIGMVRQKAEQEKAFRAFARSSAHHEYDCIIDRIDSLCAAARDTIYDLGLMSICLSSSELRISPRVVNDYVAAVREGKERDIERARRAVLDYYDKHLRHVNTDVDRGLCELLEPVYLKHKKLAATPAYLGDKGVTERIYTRSAFLQRERLEALLTAADTTALLSDPLYEKYASLQAMQQLLSPAYSRYKQRAAELDKVYVRGLGEMYGGTKSPDANFTLRLTYGHVCDLVPRDGVRYDWRTVLDGMFEKESRTESDYFINEDLRHLYLTRNFGIYAREDGKLPACFLSNNDITGGNSGSGVLNARGELIGLAFDGNIESLSSDLQYNPALQRCINVDIRYVLFILDKMGGSSYAIDEMDIRR